MTFMEYHESNWQCNLCSKCFDSKRGLGIHIYAMHKRTEKQKAQLHITLSKALSGHAGHPQTDAAKAKISIANKGNKSRTGMHNSASQNAKISAANKGKPKTEEHKEKLRQANLGKKASAETRAKMSASRKGRHKSVEWRRKLSISNLQTSAEGKRKETQYTRGVCENRHGESLFYQSSLELMFIQACNDDDNVLELHRCKDRIQYSADGVHHYNPDFECITKDGVFVIETKPSKFLANAIVQQKACAAKQYYVNSNKRYVFCTYEDLQQCDSISAFLRSRK